MHRDEQAVSDVIGSLLMILLTVGLGVGLSLLLQVYEGPQDSANVILSVRHTATGDVEISHKGGEALPQAQIQVRIEHNGTLTTYTDGQLGGGWSDGTLSVGETWTIPVGLQSGDTLSVGIIHMGTNEVLASIPAFTIA